MARSCRWPLVFAVELVGMFMIARASSVQGEGESANAADSTSLLRRIAALEERVAELEKRPPVVQYAAAPAPAAKSEVPKNWGSTQFNGQTVYFVPLNGGASSQKPLAAPAK
jgi:hypothetical protein